MNGRGRTVRRVARRRPNRKTTDNAMKKYALILTALAAFSTASAQVAWNARGGMNFSWWHSASHVRAMTGYKVGAGMDYAFADGWSVQPSLLLSAKGAELDLNESAFTGFRQLYLELPVELRLHCRVGEKQAVIISAGPYVGLGIAGNISSKNGDESLSTFGRNGLRRFDVGAGIGAAYEFYSFMVGADFQTGFRKLGRGEGYSTAWGNPRNAGFSLWVGYIF